MESIYDFLVEHKDVAFASIDKDGNPAVRVFQIMKIDSEANKLYLATSTIKEVYRELKNNPNVEILGFQGNISVRLRGRVAFDVSEEMSKIIYRDNPVLPRLYKSFTDLIYFSFSVLKADYFDLRSTPPTTEHYDLK